MSMTLMKWRQIKEYVLNQKILMIGDHIYVFRVKAIKEEQAE